MPDVVRYISTRKEHHGKVTFQEEYRLFLDKFEIDYDVRYIFKAHEQT
ncbi:hypothetical protein LZD49_23160 [Dyadobacter sp. CY261]|nr:hypothetical protein [Dyadobacter sp. CY261]MCF0073397.1 hypothetical protein [Dyadobacter sp. CY261]